MSPRLGLLKRLSNSDAILPPPSRDTDVKIPLPPAVPSIKEPTEQELEEQEFNNRIWNELRERLRKQREFDNTLDEVQKYVRDHKERNTPTEVVELFPAEPHTERYVPMSERPTLLNAKLNANDLLKLCSNFYKLCTK